MNLLASLHDVAPPNAAAIERLWDLCVRAGLCPALLVVPDWHGRAPIESDPHFVGWLRARAEEGAEILLHGERHDEVGLGRGFADHLRAVGRTAREGEFLTLDERAAGERIGRGLARLCRLGLEPIGFVPPAWLAREATHRAAAQAGLCTSEDEHTIRVFPANRIVESPTWRWSGRSAARAAISAAAARARWIVQGRQPVVRVALHPADLDHASILRSIERTLARLCADHRPTSYAELVAEVSLSAP